MNKTVELVNEWAAFEEAHPEAGVEEFCRYYLTVQRSKRNTGQNFMGGGIPHTSKSYLMKLLGYINRLFHVYVSNAMAEIPEIKQPEDFYFLNNISNFGECRKTDVIHQQLLGLSTGIDTLNRLLIAELIEERSDPSDKRAKLVRVTEKGRQVLQQCYRQAGKVNDILLHDMSDDDVKLCIQLLRGVEIKHTPLIFELKDKPIDEVFEKITGRASSDNPLGIQTFKP